MLAHYQLRDAASRHACLEMQFMMGHSARQAHQNMCRMMIWYSESHGVPPRLPMPRAQRAIDHHSSDEDAGSGSEAETGSSGYITATEEEMMMDEYEEETFPFDTIRLLFKRFAQNNFTMLEEEKYSANTWRGETRAYANSLILLHLKTTPPQYVYQRPNFAYQPFNIPIEQLKVTIGARQITIVMKTTGKPPIDMFYEDDGCQRGTWITSNGCRHLARQTNFVYLAACEFHIALLHAKQMLKVLEVDVDVGKKKKKVPYFTFFNQLTYLLACSNIRIKTEQIRLKLYGTSHQEQQSAVLNFWYRLQYCHGIEQIVIRLTNKDQSEFLDKLETTKAWKLAKMVDLDDEYLRGFTPLIGYAQNIKMCRLDSKFKIPIEFANPTIPFNTCKISLKNPCNAPKILDELSQPWEQTVKTVLSESWCMYEYKIWLSATRSISVNCTPTEITFQVFSTY